jgi:hypothetical protein
LRPHYFHLDLYWIDTKTYDTAVFVTIKSSPLLFVHYTPVLLMYGPPGDACSSSPFFYSFLQSKTLARRDICWPVTTMPSQIIPTPTFTLPFRPLFVSLSPFYVFRQRVLHRTVFRNRHAVALWCAASGYQMCRECSLEIIHSRVIVRKSNMLNYKWFKSSVQCDQYMKLYLASHILTCFGLNRPSSEGCMGNCYYIITI